MLMDRRILNAAVATLCLMLLGATITVVLWHAIEAEQREREYGQLTISRSAYLSYEAQYLRAEE